MKKHIFLTGEVQIGKSTIISKAVDMLGITPAGFRTKGAHYQPDGSSDVVIYPAEKTPEEGYAAAHRSPTGKTVFTEIFNTFGTIYLKRPAELILMDELGYMESSADEFQMAVFETLDGETPVLGVIRNKSTPFLDAVRKRDDIILITVTEQNRDFIPEKIVYFINGIRQGRA
ncbi:MAG TPA: hypothetical protein O0X42_03780 [Methanocorpusculum sp.]|nr:hypothetical protein [Methanocorpusculum sp.]